VHALKNCQPIFCIWNHQILKTHLFWEHWNKALPLEHRKHELIYSVVNMEKYLFLILILTSGTKWPLFIDVECKKLFCVTWQCSSFLVLGVMTADQIGPNKENSLTKKEGETVTLSCSYSTSNSYRYLFWYRQYANREPQYLIYKPAGSATSTGSPSDPRFQSTTSDSSTELIINGVTLSDSALYYCALEPSDTKSMWSCTKTCINFALWCQATSNPQSIIHIIWLHQWKHLCVV